MCSHVNNHCYQRGGRKNQGMIYPWRVSCVSLILWYRRQVTDCPWIWKSPKLNSLLTHEEMSTFQEHLWWMKSLLSDFHNWWDLSCWLHTKEINFTHHQTLSSEWLLHLREYQNQNWWRSLRGGGYPRGCLPPLTELQRGVNLMEVTC